MVSAFPQISSGLSGFSGHFPHLLSWLGFWILLCIQFSSVTQLCPTLCHPMNHSTPGLPVHHQLQSPPKPMSIESVMPSNHLILFCPLLLLPAIFPALGSFPVSQLFASVGQSIGASVSASVLSMIIQGWFPLGLTGLIKTRSFKRTLNFIYTFP